MFKLKSLDLCVAISSNKLFRATIRFPSYPYTKGHSSLHRLHPMDDYRYDESLAIPSQLAYNQANKLAQTCDQETAFPRSLAPSQKVCRFFVRGFCRRGSSCWFNHDPDILLSNMGYIDGRHPIKGMSQWVRGREVVHPYMSD